VLVVLVAHYCAGAGRWVGPATSSRRNRVDGSAWGAHGEALRQSCVCVAPGGSVDSAIRRRRRFGAGAGGDGGTLLRGRWGGSATSSFKSAEYRVNGSAWEAHGETLRQSCVCSAWGVGRLGDQEAEEVRC
jgi:hypothetical protein